MIFYFIYSFLRKGRINEVLKKKKKIIVLGISNGNNNNGSLNKIENNLRTHDNVNNDNDVGNKS
jgi:hypothetical protein